MQLLIFRLSPTRQERRRGDEGAATFDKPGAAARQLENVHLMHRGKTADFAKQDFDVTLGRIGSRISLPWLLK
jgi:hypothetical protein